MRRIPANTLFVTPWVLGGRSGDRKLVDVRRFCDRLWLRRPSPDPASHLPFSGCCFTAWLMQIFTLALYTRYTDLFVAERLG